MVELPSFALVAFGHPPKFCGSFAIRCYARVMRADLSEVDCFLVRSHESPTDASGEY